MGWKKDDGIQPQLQKALLLIQSSALPQRYLQQSHQDHLEIIMLSQTQKPSWKPSWAQKVGNWEDNISNRQDLARGKLQKDEIGEELAIPSRIHQFSDEIIHISAQTE